jgi:hypothetical protein
MTLVETRPDVRRELALELGPPLGVGVWRTPRGSAPSSPATSASLTVILTRVCAALFPAAKFPPEVHRQADERQYDQGRGNVSNRRGGCCHATGAHDRCRCDRDGHRRARRMGASAKLLGLAPPSRRDKPDSSELAARPTRISLATRRAISAFTVVLSWVIASSATPELRARAVTCQLTSKPAPHSEPGADVRESSDR